MTGRPEIVFVCEVSQVRTLADGGLRLVLDLPEDAIDVATWMMERRTWGDVVKVHATLPSKSRKSDER